MISGRQFVKLGAMTSQKHIFGLGQCSLDYIGIIGEFPQPDSKCEFTGLTVQGGGPVATALVALVRWGMRCTFCGVTGDDSFGKEIRDSLSRENVNTDRIAVRPQRSSQIAFIAAEPENSRRTIFWQRPTGHPLTPREVDTDLIGASAMVHTDGLFIEAAIHAAAAAKRMGIPVSVDAGTLRDGMLELARVSDYFIASESFGRQLIGADDPESACRAIAQLGPRVAGITLGERGYAAYEGGRMIRKPAYKVKTVDTTGCGDVFHGGFIFGVLSGLDTETSLDIGAWAASRVSTMPGGRTGIPPLGELNTRFGIN